MMEQQEEAAGEGHSAWSIWIDIEGFSQLWSRDRFAVRGLRALMTGIHRLGTMVYVDAGERLFAHQFGDGFVIVADFHEASLDRCAAIAVALMRHVARSGCCARAAIAEGEFADIRGFWPSVLREADGDEGLLRLGDGLMTLLPVMGTALINAIKLDEKNPLRGSVLTIASKAAHRVSAGFPRQFVDGAPYFTVIDWVHATGTELDRIEQVAALIGETAKIEAALAAYFNDQKPPEHWIAGTCLANDLQLPGTGPI